MQIQSIMTKGINQDSLDKARQLVEQKTEEIGKLAGTGKMKLSGQWEALQGVIKSLPGGEEVCVI